MADCILIGNSGIETTGESYEVGEIETGGTWVDNKLIYRLIINNIDTQNFSIDVSSLITGNIDTVINIEAYMYSSVNSRSQLLTTQSTNNTYGYYNKNNTTLYINNGDSSYVIKWVMLSYTKNL